MRSKVPDCAKPKMGKLVEPMTLLEWWIFFLNKKEGTASKVISVPHRGIYKSCAPDEVLVVMHMTIVFLSFELGLKRVYRWHKIVG